MRNSYLTAGLIVFVLFGCQQKQNQNINDNSDRYNQLTQAEIAEGWRLLFDGKTLNGWHNFNNESVKGWKAEDNLLICEGSGGEMGGDLITAESFEDFELLVDWAISKEGNSGIFFHVLENNYPAPYATGPEYQLIDDLGFPEKLEEWQKTGADYAMYEPAEKTLKPVGEFNTSRIVVKNGFVGYWLNGKKTVGYRLWTKDWKNKVQNSKWKDFADYGRAISGRIGLQNHGSVIKFRNLKIRDLTDKGTALFNGADLKGWKIHGTEKWFVENNELVGESGNDKQYGYLATEGRYKNFILRLQFKQEANGNSGVFFHSSLEGTDIKGWQVEIAPPGFDTGGIYETGGRGWLYQIPDEKEKVLQPGEWNDLIIKVENDRVMSWLNNELMTDIHVEEIGKAAGVIALQIHDGGDIKVRWRNIYLRGL